MSLLQHIIQRDLLSKTTLAFSLVGLLVFVFDFGFDQSESIQLTINLFYFLILGLGIASTIVRYLTHKDQLKQKVFTFDILSTLIVSSLLIAHFGWVDHDWMQEDNWLKVAIFLTLIRELFEREINFAMTPLNPAQLFIVSFVTVILMGALLLLLPNATYDGITFIDALFTATSAVCVTGLIVVDTSTYFTTMGQIIILILIQIGGLGILTFASYFGYFFREGSTFQNQLLLRDLTNTQKISDVFSTIKRVVMITFVVELLGVFCIYMALDSAQFSSWVDRIYFAIFHSISAFCNAGFSTLSNSLLEDGYQFNYSLHIILVLIFFLGGLGFPIVSNLLTYVRYLFVKFMLKFRKKIDINRPWIINLDSRITLITTLILIIIGTLGFYFTEYNNTLANHEGIGKWVTAFFGGMTPRTAGFNTVDMSQLQQSTIMLTILLMWIGASPASTGGGIKTSTFAMAILNFWALAKGSKKIEIFNREIAPISINRAFAIISLSLIVIFVGVFMIGIFNPELSPTSIVFECFSAYSTVGLSLGITAKLTTGSKLIVIVIMFIGRVSMLSILIALLKQAKHKHYSFPKEELIIN